MRDSVLCLVGRAILCTLKQELQVFRSVITTAHMPTAGALSQLKLAICEANTSLSIRSRTPSWSSTTFYCHILGTLARNETSQQLLD